MCFIRLTYVSAIEKCMPHQTKEISAEMRVIYMAIPMNVSEIEPKDIRR